MMHVMFFLVGVSTLAKVVVVINWHSPSDLWGKPGHCELCSVRQVFRLMPTHKPGYRLKKTRAVLFEKFH